MRDFRGKRYTYAIGAALLILAACSKQSQSANVAPASPEITVQPISNPPPEVRGNAVETEVPLEEEGGTFVVPVSINDTIVLKFTIDSGASDVTIPMDVASTLVRSGTITHDDFIGDQTFILADGTTVPSAEFRIRTLKVGTLVLHDVTGSLGDPRGPLLLGQSFLSRLSSWSIDNSRHVLVAKALGPDVEAASSPAAFPQLASISPPTQTALAPGEASNEQPNTSVYETAARAYLAAWSDPSDPDGAGTRRFYAPVVHFYGKDLALDQLMSQKLAFAQRWPSRSYAPRPASLSTQCKDLHTCTVSGIIDWRASNPASGRQSAGVATFAMTFHDGLIAAESGSVLARQ